MTRIIAVIKVIMIKGMKTIIHETTLSPCWQRAFSRKVNTTITVNFTSAVS